MQHLHMVLLLLSQASCAVDALVRRQAPVILVSQPYSDLDSRYGTQFPTMEHGKSDRFSNAKGNSSTPRFMHDGVATSTATAPSPQTPAADATAQLALPPVDVIYAFVNGTDPAFKRRYIKHTNASLKCARIQSSNELLMGLTALCKFQPWVNHVYIAVDQQLFSLEFLAPACREKVSFVDLSAFVPKEYLPTYNSHVFETFLHLIPGLSDNFLYLNDDMLLVNEIDPSSMFSPGGLLRIRLSHKPHGRPSRQAPWLWPRQNAEALAAKAFNTSILPGYDAHTAYILNKGSMQLAWDMFGQRLRPALLHNKVRMYDALANDGDTHFTLLSQLVGVLKGLLVDGSDVSTHMVKGKGFAEYAAGLFNSGAHIVCAQDMRHLSLSQLGVLCRMVAGVWCQPGVHCQRLASMCSRRAPCKETKRRS